MSEILCVVPARGGSRGIPKKNLSTVSGLPLVARSVRAALGASTVTRVVVSTDDDEIAAVARRWGAEVVRRPADLAGDEASSESALLHVLAHLEATEGYRPEVLAFVQCTSPLTTAADIDGTVRRVTHEGDDCALTVTTSHAFLWRRGADGEALGVNHDASTRLRRQDREQEYVETGAVYAMGVAGFRRAGHRFFGRVGFFVQDPERHLEIDEPADLLRAEAIERARVASDGAAPPPERIEALVLDFDGVLTDNAVQVADDGTESVRCHRGDGMGISRLRERGVAILVLSKERNPVVSERCAKLRVPCVQGLDDKLSVLRRWADEQQVALANTIYVGNDINDAECLEAVGYPVVVQDAHESVLPLAALRLTRPGGYGAVRELTDLVESHLNRGSP